MSPTNTFEKNKGPELSMPGPFLGGLKVNNFKKLSLLNQIMLDSEQTGAIILLSVQWKHLQITRVMSPRALMSPPC